MLIETFYREDLIASRKKLDLLESTLQSAREDEWKKGLEGNRELFHLLTEFDSDMIEGCRRARRILNDIESNLDAGGLSSFGLMLAVTVQSLQNEARSLEGALVAMESPAPREIDLGNVNRLLSWLRASILPVVGRIVGSVWKILINALPVRSWKIEGEIGPLFPGLKEGELVIDFGRSH